VKQPFRLPSAAFLSFRKEPSPKGGRGGKMGKTTVIVSTSMSELCSSSNSRARHWFPADTTNFCRCDYYACIAYVWHDDAMSPTVKLVLVAVVSFVLGHLSCALIHHMHHAHHIAR